MQKPHSVIRSFVRRERRFTKGQQAALKKYWYIYGIETTDTVLDLPDVFGNSMPVILDIGFGNGDALVSLARQHSHLNFLGVEVYRPGIGSLLRKLDESGLENVRIINMDVVDLLHERIAAKSIISTLIWFPDPWPKKRHHKRRLIQTGFVQLIAEKLVDGGELYIVTDWQPYAIHVCETLKQCELFHEVDTSEVITDRPKTKFEQRGENLGHQVYARIYKKMG